MSFSAMAQPWEQKMHGGKSEAETREQRKQEEPHTPAHTAQKVTTLKITNFTRKKPKEVK